MAGPFHTHSPARRDAAVRRLRLVNRSLIGIAVLSGAVLTEVAAQAFPGRTIKTVAGTTTPMTASPADTASARAAKLRRHRRHTSVAALAPPVSPPVSSSNDLPASSGGPSATSGGPSATSGGPSATSGGPSDSSGSAPVYNTPAPVAVAAAPAPAPAPVVSGGS